jgi:cell division septal protein FtsQ
VPDATVPRKVLPNTFNLVIVEVAIVAVAALNKP